MAKQAEVAGATMDQDRFMEQTDRALQAALESGNQAPDHRVAEGVPFLKSLRESGSRWQSRCCY